MTRACTSTLLKSKLNTFCTCTFGLKFRLECKGACLGNLLDISALIIGLFMSTATPQPFLFVVEREEVIGGTMLLLVVQ